MPTISEIGLPLPPTYQEFESIVCDYFTHTFKIPFQKWGRPGQAQYGIDLLGGNIGVQCKNYINTPLTIQKLENDILQAEQLDPPLERMFIVTTAREDVNIQQYVRRRAGKFSVEIYYWSVIKNFLLENQTIKDKYYPIINNTVETNVWDYIRYRAKEKNEDLYVKIFLDDLGIIYEGSLRYHESEPEKEQTLCLSGYRRYKKNEYGKYKVTHDYADDTSRLVLVKINDIKRVEIKYDSNK